MKSHNHRKGWYFSQGLNLQPFSLNNATVCEINHHFLGMIRTRLALRFGSIPSLVAHLLLNIKKNNIKKSKFFFMQNQGYIVILA
jgi:hypothetical protein